MMTATTLKTLGCALAIFAAGAITGGVVSISEMKRMRGRPPQPHDIAEHMRERLRSGLILTAAQMQKINPMIEKTTAEMSAIHSETMARVAKVIEDFNAQIAVELTPEQRQKLDSMNKEDHEFLPHGPHRGDEGDPHHHGRGPDRDMPPPPPPPPGS